MKNREAILNTISTLKLILFLVAMIPWVITVFIAYLFWELWKWLRRKA